MFFCSLNTVEGWLQWMIKKRKQCDKVDWDNIEVVFVVADKNNLNPLNPNGKLSAKARRKRIIDLGARILRDSN